MATDAPLILLIEDELAIRKFLRASLVKHGYRLGEAENGQQGLLMLRAELPDVVILDLGLPDIDGLEVTRQLREWSKVPVVVLSARGQERDKVAALDAGADDYLTKPFGVSELLARIRVALRHKAIEGQMQAQQVFKVGELKVDLINRLVYVNDAEVHLTPLEYRMLSTMAQHGGKVLTHSFLLREVWGPASEQDTPYLRVFMASLRRKLEGDPARPRYLLTEQGVGYRLAVD